jgi:hypothetical protein
MKGNECNEQGATEYDLQPTGWIDFINIEYIYC